MKPILIIGAGFMGAGIAQVCLQKGHQVILCDTGKQMLEKASQSMAGSLEKLHQKGHVAEPAATVMERLQVLTDLEHAVNKRHGLSWVIEAVYEDETLKKELLTHVETCLDDQTLIATNTSSIPVSRLALVLRRPDRFLGLHFFGPVPLMGLVEVVKGEQTSEASFLKGMDFIRELGKYPVGVTKDLPGFVMNRIFAAAFRECQELVKKGVVTPEEIDTGMRLGYGWQAGPFQIADNAGLDTVLRIKKSMAASGEIHLFSDAGLVEAMVEKGHLGRKSGRGFYAYDKTKKR